MGKTASSLLTAASGFPLFVETTHDMRPRQTAPVSQYFKKFLLGKAHKKLRTKSIAALRVVPHAWLLLN
jgi:hypothetical protein